MSGSSSFTEQDQNQHDDEHEAETAAAAVEVVASAVKRNAAKPLKPPGNTG
jgi:hypothetical protein